MPMPLEGQATLLLNSPAFALALSSPPRFYFVLSLSPEDCVSAVLFLKLPQALLGRVVASDTRKPTHAPPHGWHGLQTKHCSNVTTGYPHSFPGLTWLPVALLLLISYTFLPITIPPICFFFCFLQFCERQFSWDVSPGSSLLDITNARLLNTSPRNHCQLLRKSPLKCFECCNVETLSVWKCNPGENQCYPSGHQKQNKGGKKGSQNQPRKVMFAMQYGDEVLRY